MATFITFRDWDIFYKWPWTKVSWLADNKIGYLTKTGQVLYPLRRHIKTTKVETIKRYTKLALPADHPNRDNIDTFFTRNVPNRTLFYHGVNALRGEGEYTKYFDNPIKLPILELISNEEWGKRWERFLSLLSPGDSIQIIDTSSFISRIIARYDQGSWSHTATYIGGGYVAEAIPVAGVVIRPIEVYRYSRYRLGLYRIPHTPESRKKFIGLFLSKVGDRYSYKKAFAVALRKLLGLKPVMPLLTPNELVVLSNFPLICVV